MYPFLDILLENVLQQNKGVKMKGEDMIFGKQGV